MGPALTQLGAQLPQSSGLITVLIVQAVAKALEQFPALNMQFNGADLMPVANANIAIAVARDDGAVAARSLVTSIQKPHRRLPMS